MCSVHEFWVKIAFDNLVKASSCTLLMCTLPITLQPANTLKIPHVVICSVYFGLDCFEVSEFTTGVCSAGSGSASNGMDAAPPSQTKRAAGMYTHIHLYIIVTCTLYRYVSVCT